MSATSDDGGASWTELRLTPSSFSSAAAEWSGFNTQFLGDYLGLAVLANGAIAVYPSTAAGDLDVFARRISISDIFADGFESGDLMAW